MVLIGRIFREGPGWAAHCEAIGAFTQGPTRKEATANLAEVVEMKIDRPGFKASVSELAGEDVFVDANEPGLLAAEVLKYQREIHNLSLADVAKKLGAKSLNAYAAYEQGTREPSLGKFRELLGAIAPEMALYVGPRTSTKRRSKAG